jgi:uncharacterized DUF497 family protein
MAFTFDPEKSARNLAQRGLWFDMVARVDGVLHAAVVTRRGGDLRVISFRIANRKERNLYGGQDEKSGF